MTTEQLSTLQAMGLFTGAPQHENFNRMAQLLPSTQMPPSSSPRPWRVGSPVSAPETFEGAGTTKSFEDFFAETDTAALLMIEDGEIRYERYALTGGIDVPWISMSVAKSFVSTLVGIALEEGYVTSLDQPISDYITVQPGSAYDGVSIKDVLRMSSGARWNEDYADPDSEVFGLNAAMAGIGALEDLVAAMVRESEPGTVCRYNSGETQALGLLVIKATGRTLSDYMHEKLVEPLGFEAPSYWMIDAAGVEQAFACLNATARDFARLGDLFLNRGAIDGRQIVSEQWVKAATTWDDPMRAPGMPIVGSDRVDLGYGYQWWLPGGDDGEFSAMGVYNQLVYVDPTRRRVVVKLSANRAYGTTSDEATNRNEESVEFVRALARV
ncbi:serine hydrolase domain-containing protein [Aeromicrobium sp. P5_D10]